VFDGKHNGGCTLVFGRENSESNTGKKEREEREREREKERERDIVYCRRGDTALGLPRIPNLVA